MGATCRRWWCCAGAGRAMTERRWRARRDAGMLGGFSVVISATGAGERSVFHENVTQRVLRPQTALFRPFFYVFSLSLPPVVSERGLPPTRPRHARYATPLREDLPRRDHTLACMSNAKSDHIRAFYMVSCPCFVLCPRMFACIIDLAGVFNRSMNNKKQLFHMKH